MKRFITLLLLLVSVFAFAQTKETRNVGTFTKIAFRVPGKLILKQGSPQSVVLEGDKETLDKIETDVDGNKLTIGREQHWMDWSWRDENKVTVYVTVSNIEALSVSGSGDLVGSGKFSTGDLDLKGSGSVSYKGNPSQVNSHASGSGHVRKM